jgi:RHS repeat-associated protein
VYRFSSKEIHVNSGLYYYGWRVIQERDDNNTPGVSYTRGTDLSGSLKGAGGIGGLLGRSHGYSSGNWSTHNFYQADGNGNITYMLNSSQSKVAEYRYDPFGNTISSSGTLADANVYRFSSKQIHVNSGLYYYGERFYDPNTQRWLNRDPIHEDGGINLYAYVGNDSVNDVDPYGLFCFVFQICKLFRQADYRTPDGCCLGVDKYETECHYKCFPIIVIGPCSPPPGKLIEFTTCGTPGDCPLITFRLDWMLGNPD